MKEKGLFYCPHPLSLLAQEAEEDIDTLPSMYIQREVLMGRVYQSKHTNRSPEKRDRNDAKMSRKIGLGEAREEIGQRLHD